MSVEIESILLSATLLSAEGRLEGYIFNKN